MYKFSQKKNDIRNKRKPTPLQQPQSHDITRADDSSRTQHCRTWRSFPVRSAFAAAAAFVRRSAFSAAVTPPDPAHRTMRIPLMAPFLCTTSTRPSAAQTLSVAWLLDTPWFVLRGGKVGGEGVDKKCNAVVRGRKKGGGTRARV